MIFLKLLISLVLFCSTTAKYLREGNAVTSLEMHPLATTSPNVSTVMSVLCDIIDSTTIGAVIDSWVCNMTATSPVYCDWSGIYCEDNNVYYIDIRRYITGTLPNSLGLLTDVSTLSIQTTFLSGTIPSSICYMPKLSNLLLSNNYFSGPIPDCLGNASFLSKITVTNNYLNGSLPDSMRNLVHLVDVSLNNNEFSGTLPCIFDQWASLEIWTLKSNHFKGSIPDCFQQVSRLFALDLSYNSFTGSPPASFNATNLKFLNLQHNHFSGSLTESLRVVDYLNVSSNNFSGALIPESWTTSASQLRSIDLRNNALTGSIPAGLCNNDLLIRLLIDDNPIDLNSCIPACMSLVVQDFYGTLARCYGLQDQALCDLSDSLQIASLVADEILYTSLSIESTHYSSQISIQSQLVSVPNAFEYRLSFSGLTDISNQESSIGIKNGSNTFATIYPSFDTLPGYGQAALVVQADSFTIDSWVSPGEYGYAVDVTALSHGVGWTCENKSTFIDGVEQYKLFAYPCAWDGVTCDYGTLVSEISLKALSLSGRLPDSIGGLEWLQTLDLSYNNIEGTLPYSLGKMTDLTTLNLASNNLEGTIPDSFANLTSMSHLLLANNNLNGTLPDALSMMTSLEQIHLEANQFSGMLDFALCELPQQGTQIFLRSNDFSCYDMCWSSYESTVFSHDSSLGLCLPSYSPTPLPTAPTVAPSAVPLITVKNKDSQTNTIIIAVCSAGGAFLLFSVWFILFGRRLTAKIKPSEDDLKLMMMLQHCPVHRAVLDGEFVNTELVRNNIATVAEETPEGKNAFDLIMDRGEKCEISDEAMFMVLQALLPLKVGPNASMSAGSTFTSNAWCRLVQQNDQRSLRVVERVLTTYKVYAVTLANATDSFGRKCINIASPQCKEALNRKLYLNERYELFEGPPEHKTATSIVRFAYDHHTLLEDDRGNRVPKKVALKFVAHADALNRELENRSFGEASDNAHYIVTVLNSYNGDSLDDVDRAFRMDAITKGFVDYPYCVVMDAADHNLQRMIATQHIAGTDWEEIRRLFKQITKSVHYLHSKGVIHGDLKPTNIVEVDKSIRLIDFDGSVSFAKNQMAGIKFSTTYCPPEMLYVDREQKVLPKYSRVRGDALEVEDLVDLKYECVAASPALDMWALGAILYLLCTGSPLFCSNVDDNISDKEDLFMLYQWDSNTKEKKLMNVSDTLARNLISLLLVKDPQKRIDSARVKDHPFLSGKQVARLAGEQAEFQVFISYRVASDAHLAQRLYNDLTKVGVKVWLDSKCLKPGKNWEVGFCEGMLKSDYVVCCISEEGMQHSEKESQCLNRLRAESKCDNVLLEWMLALELQRRGIVKGIFPIFIGKTENERIYTKFYLSSVGMPELSVLSVEEKLKMHLDQQGCGLPYALNSTVKTVVDAIVSNQGVFLEGDVDACTADIVDRITKMVVN